MWDVQPSSSESHRSSRTAYALPEGQSQSVGRNLGLCPDPLFWNFSSLRGCPDLALCCCCSWHCRRDWLIFCSRILPERAEWSDVVSVVTWSARSTAESSAGNTVPSRSSALIEGHSEGRRGKHLRQPCRQCKWYLRGLLLIQIPQGLAERRRQGDFLGKTPDTSEKAPCTLGPLQ